VVAVAVVTEWEEVMLKTRTLLRLWVGDTRMYNNINSQNPTTSPPPLEQTCN